MLETLDLLAALSYVDARYRDDFHNGTRSKQALSWPRRNYMPGVPRRTFYGEARWAPVGQTNFSTGFELRYSDRILRERRQRRVGRSVFGW